MSPALRARLDSLQAFVLKATAPNADPEVASNLCKLGAVIACGTVERGVEIIILDRLSKKAHPRVMSFIKGHFQRGTNYTCEEIGNLLTRFDRTWGNAFTQFVRDHDVVKQSVSSCYAVRNSIAHGGAQSLGASVLKQYSDHMVLLLEAVEQITSR